MPCLWPPGGGTYFPSLPEQHLPTHWTGEWTGSLNTYHYQCGGKLRKLSGYNRLSVSSLRKISNFVIIIFAPRLHFIKPTTATPWENWKQRRPWWYFPSYPPVWNIMEQRHYLHLVYLVLLPPHIYYFSSTNQWQCQVGVWGKDYI